MKTNDFSAQNISETATDLQDGLFVLELEERLEMAALTAAVASSQRCDIEVDSL